MHAFGQRSGLEEIRQLLAHVRPETDEAHQQRKRDEHRHRAEHRHHQVVRHQRIKRTLRVAVRGKKAFRIVQRTRQPEQQRNTECTDQADRHGVVVIKFAEETGPRVAAIGLAARFCHQAREVDLKFMRRRELAGIQTGAAVVAQVAQIQHVVLGEFETARQRRKYRAVAFAVTAGVADAKHALRILDQFLEGHRFVFSREHVLPPPRPRCVRTWCRWTCRCPPGTPYPIHCQP